MGDLEVERRGGGERARSCSGAVSWYGAKSIAGIWIGDRCGTDCLNLKAHETGI